MQGIVTEIPTGNKDATPHSCGRSVNSTARRNPETDTPHLRAPPTMPTPIFTLPTAFVHPVEEMFRRRKWAPFDAIRHVAEILGINALSLECLIALRAFDILLTRASHRVQTGETEEAKLGLRWRD